MLVRHGAASQLAWREVGFPLITQPAISPERNPPKQLRQEPRRWGAGTLMVLGTGATKSIEEVAAVATGPLWFQLYDCGAELSEMLIRRAEAVRFRAICVTVDVPLQGTGKERDRRNQFRPLVGVKLANFVGERAGLGLVPGAPETSQWGVLLFNL